MKIKTQDLTGAALDWAVAKCEGEEVRLIKGQLETLWTDNGYKPSTNWALGGPIVEREGIAIDCIRCDGEIDGWIAALPSFGEAKYEEPSPTPLIAAMRCYVASKLGDEVDVPDELAVPTVS